MRNSEQLAYCKGHDSNLCYFYFYFLFSIRPSPGLLPVLGQLEWYRLLHLTQPCLVALGRVLVFIHTTVVVATCTDLL